MSGSCATVSPSGLGPCVHRLVAGAESDGLDLLGFLALRLPRAPREQWRRRIVGGEVFVGGREVRDPTAPIARGETVEWRRPSWDEPRAPCGFVVLHADAELLVVGKPRGLQTLPGGGRFHRRTLLDRLRRYDPAAVPVHRLGRPTSGVVVCGRTRGSRAHLSALLREGRLRKEYLALVEGVWRGPARRVDVPIGEAAHRLLGRVAAPDPRGRPALSIVTPLATDGATSVVHVDLITGRTHQARIHLAAIGHPLVGDPLYRSGGTPDPRALPGEGGFLLHAWRVRLTHPATGRPLCVECPPPPRLRRHTEPERS